jgi:cystathionine beta-lyase/cystathionine gamma-synthase
MTAPVDRSTTWPFVDGEPGAFTYSRFSSPTVTEAERALGELDGGEALLFSSGAAATASLALAFLAPGRTVALAEGAYYGTGVLFQELAAAHPAPVVCDATAATPLHVRPLELGCDFALHSATKFLSGHDDALVGAVVCRRAEDADRLRELRSRVGTIAAPDVAWLLLRGLATLEVRMSRQTESARAIAEQLLGHPAVLTVRYPGFGGLLSFDVADAEAARRVETETSLIRNMTSLGGVTSRIEARARWEGERVPAGLLRLSVGLEDPDALWTDLERALGAV